MVIALVGPITTLAINAATFAVSAAITIYGVRSRPAATSHNGTQTVMADSRDGLRYVFGDLWLRACLHLVWSVPMFAVAPEAIIYPYARSLQLRSRLVVPFALLAGASLLPLALQPRSECAVTHGEADSKQAKDRMAATNAGVSTCRS
jgi:hypothetical protein